MELENVKEAKAFTGILSRLVKSNPTKRAVQKLKAQALQAMHPIAYVPPNLSSAAKKEFSERVLRGVRSQGMRAGGGADSLLLFLPQMGAEKLFGTRRVRETMWKNIGAPSLRADVALGRILEKTPLVGKSLFRTKEKIPWGKGLYKEIERSSALGPLTKLRDIGEPIIVGVGLEKGLKSLQNLKKKKDEAAMDTKQQELQQKIASAMLQLHSRNKEHEKRAHAIRLIYKQAELGCEHLPQTYGEFEEKIASLITQDLVVLEKALELTAGHMKLGELGREDSKDQIGAESKFRAAVIGDEFF